MVHVVVAPPPPVAIFRDGGQSGRCSLSAASAGQPRAMAASSRPSAYGERQRLEPFVFASSHYACHAPSVPIRQNYIARALAPEIGTRTARSGRRLSVRSWMDDRRSATCILHSRENIAKGTRISLATSSPKLDHLSAFPHLHSYGCYCISPLRSARRSLRSSESLK